MGELKEEEKRWTLGLPYLTSCVRDTQGNCLSVCPSVCQSVSLSICPSACLSVLLLQLCPQHYKNNLCLQMSLFLSSLLTCSLPPPFKCPLFFTLSLSYLLSSLCACPSLRSSAPPPHPLLFSSFCACVSAMWLDVLSGLCSMCDTWRRRRCGARTGLDWASSPWWVLAPTSTLSFFTW